MRRYSYFTIILPVLVFIYAYYNYSTQHNIYQRSVAFKYNTGDVDSPTSAIATLIGEKTGVMTEAQIIGVLTSLDFQKMFADRISIHPELYHLNLSSVKAKKISDMRSYLASCQEDVQCVNVRLRGLLVSKLSIRPDSSIENRFSLIVTTLDEKTTNVLLKVASSLVVEARIASMRKQISDQLSVSKVLRDEKMKELITNEYDSLLSRKNKVSFDLKTIVSKINSMYRDYTRTKNSLSLIETRFVETKKAAKGNVSNKSKEDFVKRKKIEDKIKNIQSDIWAVEKSMAGVTNQDKSIVEQLRVDLAAAKSSLKNMGSNGRRHVASDSDYLNKKTNESNFVEFDYNVMKKQFKSLDKDYKELNRQKDIYNTELSAVSVKLAKLEPTKEYLKLISNKLMQLTVLESTVISDLVFEKEFGALRTFKNTTKSKILIFSLVFAISLVLFSIIIRYLFDDRIFDRIELEKSFEDLSIIGNTPDFD